MININKLIFAFLILFLINVELKCERAVFCLKDLMKNSEIFYKNKDYEVKFECKDGKVFKYRENHKYEKELIPVRFSKYLRLWDALITNDCFGLKSITRDMIDRNQLKYRRYLRRKTNADLVLLGEGIVRFVIGKSNNEFKISRDDLYAFKCRKYMNILKFVMQMFLYDELVDFENNQINEDDLKYLIKDSQVGFLETSPAIGSTYTLCKYIIKNRGGKIEIISFRNRKNGEMYDEKKREISLATYKKIWNSMLKDNLINLKTMTYDTYDSLEVFKNNTIPKHKPLFEYIFFFKINNKQNVFEVSNIDYLKDTRYISLLLKLSKVFGIKPGIINIINSRKVIIH